MIENKDSNKKNKFCKPWLQFKNNKFKTYYIHKTESSIIIFLIKGDWLSGLIINV